jgi:hypothetical protein
MGQTITPVSRPGLDGRETGWFETPDNIERALIILGALIDPFAQESELFFW